MLYQLPLAPRYHDFSEADLDAGIRRFKAQLGSQLVILGHHYQQDDVIAYADFTGDSLKLSQIAARQTAARYIVFCGVHFMAESADILTSDQQIVILPDLSAGCSMADMAHIDQVEAAWPLLEEYAGVMSSSFLTHYGTYAEVAGLSAGGTNMWRLILEPSGKWELTHRVSSTGEKVRSAKEKRNAIKRS